jgi:plastocyanin
MRKENVILGFGLALLLSGGDVFSADVRGTVRVTGRSGEPVQTIVFAEPLDAAASRPGHFKVSQRNKIFTPRILAVPVGSTVEFPNDDLIFHNVFSLSRPAPFDLGLYRAGSTRSRTFTSPATYRVFCNIHPQMAAIVLVLPTPYIAEAGEDGSFHLDLPAGRYRLTAWSERAQPVTTEIQVGGAEVRVSEIVIDESKFVEITHKNKHGMEYPKIAYDPLTDRKPN